MPVSTTGCAHCNKPSCTITRWMQAPTGAWKPGSYTLVLKNKTMDVELPFSLPAGELKKDAKGADDKVVPW